MHAELPFDESERLSTLRDYFILDTATEQVYDDVAFVVTQVCEVPIAIISLVDEARQWFKAKVGVSIEQTPRDVAFCAHAILQREPLVIPDAQQDLRFADNPLVTQSPGIRFYAGFPLVSAEGFALGTLCALDRKPKNLSAQQCEAMQSLGRQVMALLEARRTCSRLAETILSLRRLQGSMAMCDWCKRVRDARGQWIPVEAFIQRIGTKIDVGICPECLGRK